MTANKRNILEEMKENFMVYALDTNNNKSFPDARDGLKPGQRACLWTMYHNNFINSRPHVKSAKIDGLVAASVWPHGTTAIYETFARMSQSFTNNIPTVDFHGSNGNVILGSEFASDRYTEAKLALIAERGMLQGVNQDTVDMIWNFLEDEQWPSVLPAIFPNLLVNGTQGIGIGLATTWLPHNFQETANIILTYLDSGKLDTDSYYPDFPTGATIINQSELATVNRTGKGKVVVEANYNISGKDINFTEFPFQVYIEPLIEEIKDGIDKNKIHNVKEVFNKSDKSQILLTITCASSSNVDSVLRELFTNTSLRSQYNANQVAIVGKTPKLLTLKELIDIYIAHNLSCIKREHRFDLDKTLERIEILEGLARALKDIDNVIALIRSSKSAAEAKKYMTDKLGLTECQVDAILKMQLSRLAKLEESQILQELEEKRSLAAKLRNVVEDSEEQKKILTKRLSRLVKDFGSPRKTKVIDKPIEKITAKTKKEKEPERCVVCLADNGFYLKRVSAAQYRESSANSWAISTSTDKTVNVFTAFGKVYRVKAENIKECLAADKGTVIGSLIDIGSHDIIRAISVEDDDIDMFAVTHCGRVKRFGSQLFDGRTQNKKGSSYIKLREKDEVRLLVDLQGGKWIHFIAPKDEELVIDATTVNQSGKTSSGQVGFRFAANALDKHILSAEQLKGISVDTIIGKVGGRGRKA